MRAAAIGSSLGHPWRHPGCCYMHAVPAVVHWQSPVNGWIGQGLARGRRGDPEVEMVRGGGGAQNERRARVRFIQIRQGLPFIGRDKRGSIWSPSISIGRLRIKWGGLMKKPKIFGVVWG